MHRTTGRWRLGLALAVIAGLMWATLPIALKLLLDTLDAYTITWVRLLAAALVLGPLLATQRALPSLSRLSPRGLIILLVAVAGLLCNYVLYVEGLNYITPGAAQLVIQLAPMLMLLGGLAVFRERFNRAQWLGFVLLTIGLLLFFNHRFEELFAAASDYALGVLLIVAAAFTWACYALAQKELLQSLNSQQVLLLIYVLGSLLLLPLAEPARLLDLSALGAGLLLFGVVNTLVAYGAFAEALNHWEASRVSAVLSLTPLGTLAAMALIGLFTDAVTAEPLNVLSGLGASLVVAGSMLTALAGRDTRAAVPTAGPE